MSQEELKTLGRRITDELFNQGDLTVADELFDPHYTEHTRAWDCGTGPEGVKQLITQLRRAFPDLHSRIDDQIVEGEKLVQRITLSGTHQGRPFMGTPATGKPMTINVLGISWVSPNGKVREGWTFHEITPLRPFTAVGENVRAAAEVSEDGDEKAMSKGEITTPTKSVDSRAP